MGWPPAALKFSLSNREVLCASQAFEPHLKRTEVSADRVLLVQRNISNYIPLEDAVVFGGSETQRVLRGIVNIDSIEHRKLRHERVFCVDTEGYTVIACAGTVESGPWKPTCVVGLRKRNLVIDQSSSKSVPCPG